MHDSAEPSAAEPLRSDHTTTFPELLTHLGASLLVTTYQAGKLVVLSDAALRDVPENLRTAKESPATDAPRK